MRRRLLISAKLTEHYAKIVVGLKHLRLKFQNAPVMWFCLGEAPARAHEIRQVVICLEGGLVESDGPEKFSFRLRQSAKNYAGAAAVRMRISMVRVYR